MISQVTKEYLQRMYERDMSEGEKILASLDRIFDQIVDTNRILSNTEKRKHEFTEDELTVDLGYRGELRLTIKFTDQNCITHTRVLLIRVFGEKPTTLTIAEDARNLYITNEREKDNA